VFYVIYSSCCMFLATFVELSSFIFFDRQFHLFFRSFNLQLFILLCFVCTLFAFVLVSIYSCFQKISLLVFCFFCKFWFVFLFQLLNPISRNFIFFVCESMCIVVNNFTKTFFHPIISVLWVLINFFQHDVDIENCIVGFFFQVVLQSHHVLLLY
jgi:hypothetical protein